MIPAHNEEACLGACLDAVLRATQHPGLAAEDVLVCVVLDACDDRSADIVLQFQPQFQAVGCRLDCIEVAVRQVGSARAAGALHLIASGARWLAFTDADTRVSPQWLAAQMALGAEVVCGSVTVDDWSPHADKAMLLREHFARTYHDREDHRHIHGANLGVCALAYQAAGGFAPVACHEDVLLVRALETYGARFAWSALPRVFTSARLDARARGGFGDTLLAVTAEIERPLPAV
jgi:glycosyltransferase involved in cell wall biosynthesis